MVIAMRIDHTHLLSHSVVDVVIAMCIDHIHLPSHSAAVHSSFDVIEMMVQAVAVCRQSDPSAVDNFDYYDYLNRMTQRRGQKQRQIEAKPMM